MPRTHASGAEEPPAAMQMVRDLMVAKKAFTPLTPEHAICKINFYENDPVLMDYARHLALLLHSLLRRGSGQSRTSGFRRAISAHDARGGCHHLWGGRDRLASRSRLPVRGEGTGRRRSRASRDCASP